MRKLKKTSFKQFILAAGIAILIYLYAVAQGFTLPLHFQTKAETPLLSENSAKPTQVVTPTASPTDQPSTNPTPTPAPSSVQAITQAPLQLVESTSNSTQQVIEHVSESTQQTLIETVNKLNEELTTILKP